MTWAPASSRARAHPMLASSSNRAVTSTSTATCFPCSAARTSAATTGLSPDGRYVGIVGRLVHQLLDRGRKRVVGMVDQDILAVEHCEDAGVLLPFHRGQGRRDQRCPRFVVQLRTIKGVDGPEAVETQG